MAIVRVVVDRSQWYFAQQCAPGGNADLVGGQSHPRYQAAILPKCVAVAIGHDSEVRAVRLSQRDAYFEQMTQVVEGCPQMFRNDHATIVDLARLDWTDGRLVLECAETVEDVGSLSVLVRPFATLKIESFNTTAVALFAYLHAPRLGGGALALNGAAIRVGGAVGALGGIEYGLSSDGLRPLALATGITAAAAINGTVTSIPALALPGFTATDAVRFSVGVGTGVVTAAISVHGA